MSKRANPAPSERRIPWRRLLVALVGLVAVSWAVHPFVLPRLLKVGLQQAAADAGYELRIERMHAGWNSPVVLEKVSLRSTTGTQTAVDIASAQVSFNWPWQAFFGDKRFFREIVADDARALFDIRPFGQEKAAARMGGLPMVFLPQRFEVRRASAEVFAARRSWYVQDFSVEFDEQKLGVFHAAGGEITNGEVRQALGPATGETAWKDGSLYLANLTLSDGLKIENLEVQLARTEGLAAGLEASVFGGGLRVDMAYGLEKKVPTMDLAIWMSNVNIAPLSGFLGWQDKIEGTIKEGRFTFRGRASKALDGQASLRLAAQDFRWNDRGWESLELGASMIHRRFSVSNFSLQQKDNTLTGNGEVSLAGGWSDLAKAPFLLNLSASINSLSDLAGLLGSPFDEMTGRMSLSSSISGRDGKLGGYLSMEASDMGYRDHPIESGRVEVAFSNTEAQIAQCEFWSGSDYLRAKGTVDLARPHTYSGEIQANLRDIASYLDLLRPLTIPSIFAGSAQVRWQGDGTALAHSGAFNVSLDDFGSEFSPAGVTGRFAGTYSPQNIYFSGFELERGNMRFATRATLAASGIKLSDAVLKTGGRKTAEADVFLPFDPFLLLAGKGLAASALPKKGIYAYVQTSQPVRLRDFSRLLGRDFAGDGAATVNFSASGSPAFPEATGKLEIRNLVAREGTRPGPESQMDMGLVVSGGTARLNGTLTPKGSSAVSLKAETPLALLKGADGVSRWMNPEGPLAVRLEIPKTEVAALQPLLPIKTRIRGGSLVGDVTVAGTVAQPKFQGHLTLLGGRLQSSPGEVVVDNLKATVKFAEDKAVVENMSGTMASGLFDLKGEISLADVANPRSELFFTGYNMLLANDPELRLLANMKLKIAGDASGGTIGGEVRLLDGQVYRRLEVTPLVGNTSESVQPLGAPRFDSLAPALAAWKLDVTVQGETPFAIGGNAALGQIVPDIRLSGTLEKPVPHGRVEIRNARAFLPYTILTINQGYLNFAEAQPWVPQLDIRAEGRALDYTVQAYAFGPINERKLILRSEPALGQEALLLLLTTGLPPGMDAKAQAASPGGIGNFTRQLATTQGAAGEVVADHIPPAGETNTDLSMTAKGRFELWRRLTLTNDREGLGAGGGLTYQLRFR